MKKRKWLALILSTVMVLSTSGITSVAETVSDQSQSKAQSSNVKVMTDSDAEPATPSNATYVYNEKELQEAVKKDGEIFLMQEVALSERLVIPKNVEIDLIGGTISYSNGSELDQEKELIFISDGAYVKFIDVTVDASGQNCLIKNSYGSYTDYYAIKTVSGSRVVLDHVNIMCNDENSQIVNPRKRGLSIGGVCNMRSGTITGFPDAGVCIFGKLVMYGGEIFNNGWHKEEKFSGNGAVINVKNFVMMDGSLHDNIAGVINMSNFEMSGGQIAYNNNGLVNLDQDAQSGEKHFPKAFLNGGEIGENKNFAIRNKNSGEVTINGTLISGRQSELEKQIMTASLGEEKDVCVVWNQDGSTLNLNGGSIYSQLPGEVAIFNDQTSHVVMTDGEIWTTGDHSMAIKNKNASAAAVKISGGVLGVTGEGSQLFDSNGYIEVTEDVAIAGEEVGKYLIAVFSGEGGTVTPNTQLATTGDTIHFTFTPNSGYRVAEIKVDGISKGAVTSYDLVVEGRHTIEATYVKKTSSGGGSSGGSSSGGSSHTSTSKKTTAAIPETPGTWQQDQNGWRMTAGDGSAYTNTWVYKNSQWYWIGSEGYMLQGWNLINGKWFYLTPTTGEMKVGWILDNGIWYFSDDSGVRQNGWIQNVGRWYYLDEEGKLIVNGTTPDGYTVDGTGAWIE